jgi:hypothetical protein
LNLRGALYRALTDLKKDGVLGKEILLRKTMLDECKGEKFEEVISTFALTVLRKVAKARCDVHLELACSNRLTRQQQAQLLPLIIAHRCSLRQHVSQRHRMTKNAQVYSGLLAQCRVSIENRRARLSKLPVPEAGEKAVTYQAVTYQAVSDSWLGDSKWAEILLSVPIRSEDGFLETPFEEGWKAVLDGSSVDIEHQPNLLDDLNARIANQETRLRKWKTFAASLRNTQVQKKDVLSAQIRPEKHHSTVIQFDRHQELQFSDKLLSPQSKGRRSPTAAIHKKLLTSLEADLAILRTRNTAKRSSARGEQLADPHKPSQNSLEPTAALSVFTPVSSSSDESRTTGYDLCKDTSARSLELESPVYQQVESLSGGISAPVYLRSQKQPSRIKEDIKSPEERVLTSFADQLNLSGGEKSYDSEINTSERTPAHKKLDELLKTQSSFTVTKATSISVVSSHNKNEFEDQTELPVSKGNSSKLETKSITTDRNAVCTMAPPPTLVERTRQSMSLLTNPADRAMLRAPTKRGHLSQAFPMNQFETPRKVKTSESSQPEWTLTRSGSSTPRDELFSDAAAYDSVFKSRPRIALSPALSPDRSGIGLDSMLEQDLADLTLDSGA